MKQKVWVAIWISGIILNLGIAIYGVVSGQYLFWFSGIFAVFVGAIFLHELGRV